MQDFEKLGTFYMGKRYDQNSDAVTDDLLLYDSKDLTTHALVVGMTGSGKTGLSISLLEEAAIDGIPAIAIDPKGDLSNLFLTFPKLAPEDFEPWIDPSEAARKGMDVKAYSKKTANMWKDGLAGWGEDGKRIKKFKDACELAIYTPGSTAGRPLRVLQSFTAPSDVVMNDSDAMRERVSGVVSGLLSLLDIDADPIRSREHILLSKLIDHAWRAGSDYQLSSLIAEVQSPPFDKLGVMDLETFFPLKDRTRLSMNINGLLASPGFDAWMTGEPLDINSLLYTKDGKPKLSILSIAHLSEKERMFFVSLLLNEVVAWVRSQPGTSSLRALLYMDEVAGYFPPTANPPSKPPMLTLLKQARAHGLGVVLATQNPVDLDYKGLSNMGTWFLGRLQTEQDKNRVLDGLESASGHGLDRAEISKLLSGLKSRVFLMNNVHDKAPVLFHTRWALSYLRGPLTRDQINLLAQSGKPKTVEPKGEKLSKTKQKSAEKPALPPSISEVFFQATDVPDAGEKMIYRPALIANIQLHFNKSAAGVDQWKNITVLAPIHGEIDANPWEISSNLNEKPLTTTEAPESAHFANLPAEAMRDKSYASWKKKLKSSAYKNNQVIVYHAPSLKVYGQANQSLDNFKGDMRLALREKRDLMVEKVKAKYAPKLERIQDKILTQEHRVERETQESRGDKLQAAVAIGSTLLGALFGRKITSSRSIGSAASAIKKSLGLSKSGADVDRAKEKLVELQEDLEILDVQFNDAIEDLQNTMTIDNVDIKEIVLRPLKTDLEIGEVTLAWTPWIIDQDGVARRAF